MKWMAACPALVIFLAFPFYLYAQTVILKSGKRIEGKITERTGDYIKIEFEGRSVYYYLKYIQSIEDSGGENSPASAQNQDSAGGAKFYLKRGLSYAAEGKLKEAQEEFYKGLSINKSDYNINGALKIIEALKSGTVRQDYAAYLFKGSYYLLNEEYGEAIANLGNALQLNPNDLDVCYNLGVAHYYINEFEPAIEYLKKTAELRPGDADAYGFLGSAYYALGQYQKAKENLLIAKDLFLKAGDQVAAYELGSFIKTISSEGSS